MNKKLGLFSAVATGVGMLVVQQAALFLLQAEQVWSGRHL